MHRSSCCSTDLHKKESYSDGEDSNRSMRSMRSVGSNKSILHDGAGAFV